MIPPPLPPPPEILVARIQWAFAIGLQMGPVRLDFTDRRFVIASTVPPAYPPALALYRSWRASIPGGPACRLVGAPYGPEVGEVWAEIPNTEMSSIRAHREVGLWTDKTVSDLDVSNIRQGLQIVLPGGTKPGVNVHSPEAMRFTFRVPASPDEIHAFLLQTPWRTVARPP
jgi:hypothetical protein